MKDPPLRLLPSSPSRLPSQAKTRALALKTFRRLKRSETQHDCTLFPKVTATLYISAVKPEEMTKTNRAYHEVDMQRQAIRPDKEAKARTFEEPKGTIEVAKSTKRDSGTCEDVSNFCVCNRPYERGELMFKCEGYCGNWYHPRCLGMEEAEIDRHCKTKERWYCNDCYERAHTLLITCGPSRKTK